MLQWLGLPARVGIFHLDRNLGKFPVPGDIGEGAVRRAGEAAWYLAIDILERSTMSTPTGGCYRRPESSAAPGPAQSMVGVLTNLQSKGAFRYEALESKSASTTTNVEPNSPKSRQEEDQVHCSCGPFLGSRAKHLGGGRNRSTKASELRGSMHETPATSFLFRLLASYARLRESIKETNMNAYDLFVGNQMLCLLTASPIISRAKTASSPPGSSGRLTGSSGHLTLVPITSFSKNSSTPGQTMAVARVQSGKFFPSCSRGCDSDADRRLLSFRK